ncbi:MAG TPA: cytochrome c biogenesis protein ResB [Nitrospirae bacterium]|nr:cytochrome c biogenesis protein CcsB [bacterium BMS3Abin06]HDH11366.1 cytochrome c biogenesis protein ResB [Nitrospirota bacterium]HDZ03369.1 cytochrome c biogenesis protein ResB [Nitrospirota bacterium]
MEEKEKKKKDIFESVWKFLASVKLAIFIFIVLSISSIIGTIVEQQAEPAKNIALLAKFFGDSAAPTVYNVFAKLGFMDMYRSWWFIGLLLLFSINLIVCSLDRFPKTWRLIKKPQKPLSGNALNSLPIKKELTFKSSLNIAKDEFLNILHASGYRVFEASESGSVRLYTQKGKYARLAVYAVHLSIILIFIGAIIGARFGFGGYLNLREGGASNTAYKSPAEPIPLGFTIKCNWYDTLYYEGIDTPREFQSELVIIEDGKEVLKKVIEVNDPLTYKGITFFQASYGMIPDATGYFVLDITPDNGPEKRLWLKSGETFEIPGTGIKGTIIDFSPALTRDGNTGALTTYSESMVNPAVAIEFDWPGKEKFTGWILKRYPETGMLPGGHSVKFADYWGVEYTGLQVSKDPGIWFIYIASIIMAAGLYICFFISHKKIWINIADDKKSVRIVVGGSTSRNRLNLENEIEKIVSHAAQAIEGRSGK